MHKKLSHQNILMSLSLIMAAFSVKKTQIAVKQIHQEAQNKEEQDRLSKLWARFVLETTGAGHPRPLKQRSLWSTAVFVIGRGLEVPKLQLKSTV